MRRVVGPRRGQVVGGRPAATPRHGVCDHALYLGLKVNRVLLVPRAEVKDAPSAAVEAAAAAKHLAALERADEDELVRRRDVEELAVHLLVGDDEGLRDTRSDRMVWADGPDDLALAHLAPPQPAAGPHQPHEDLRLVARMQDDQAHAVEYPLVN